MTSLLTIITRLNIFRMIFFIFLIHNNTFVFSQNKPDTVIVILDSLFFQSFIYCEDEILKTRCSDTIYKTSTFEDFRNSFLNLTLDLSFIDNRKKETKGESLDAYDFNTKKKQYDNLYKCKSFFINYDFPLHSFFYIKIMYLNRNCDSIVVLEGDFYQNQKFEFYYCGRIKVYDINGIIQTDGNYYFSKEGERSVSFPQTGMVSYGEVPRKHRNEIYRGAFIKAKKNGTWNYYQNGRLIKTENYTKGVNIKNSKARK